VHDSQSCCVRATFSIAVSLPHMHSRGQHLKVRPLSETTSLRLHGPPDRLVDRHGTTVCILQFFNLISKSCHGMVHLSPAEHSELAGCIDIVIRGLMPLMSSSASRSTVDGEVRQIIGDRISVVIWCVLVKVFNIEGRLLWRRKRSSRQRYIVPCLPVYITSV